MDNDESKQGEKGEQNTNLVADKGISMLYASNDREVLFFFI